MLPTGNEFHEEYELLWQRWASERWSWENYHEPSLPADDRLDEVGWEIAYYLFMRGVPLWEGAREAMTGTYRKRLLVKADLLVRHQAQIRKRWEELHPAGVPLSFYDTRAPEQLDFWSRHLRDLSYVYFIQHGKRGPVKIGLSNDPELRLRKLQTGNPRELHLRHVIPGDRQAEGQLHSRFRPALIRGEWFGGRAYLPMILAFASGLADEMIHSYDGTGQAPRLTAGRVLGPADVGRMRREIERLWREGHDEPGIASLIGLQGDELAHHLEEMRQSPLYDVRVAGGFVLERGRVRPARTEASRTRLREQRRRNRTRLS